MRGESAERRRREEKERGEGERRRREEKERGEWKCSALDLTFEHTLNS